MRIDRIVWLESVAEKLWRKHAVELDEAADVLTGQPHFRFVEKGHRPGEDVYAALGQTRGGRYLIVFFVRKANGAALVMSAREMTSSERRRYEGR